MKKVRTVDSAREFLRHQAGLVDYNGRHVDIEDNQTLREVDRRRKQKAKRRAKRKATGR